MNRWRSFLLAAGVAVVGVSGYFLQTENGTLAPMARERVERGRAPRGGGSPTAGEASFALAQSYAYPYAGADRVPLCTDDPECVFVCHVGAVTGSATAWECKGHDGLSVGTVTDPGGTVIDSLIPGVKAREITAADAPSIASAAIDALFAPTQAYTVVVGGFTRASSSPNYFWADGDATVNITFQARTAGNMTCNNSVAAPLSSTSITNGWGLASCRWNGASEYKATVNLASNTTTDATGHGTPTGGGEWYMGTNSARSVSFDGPMVFVAGYSTSKSDAYMTTLMAKFYGTYSATGVLGSGVGQLTGEDNTATTGNVDMILPYGGQVISSSGALTSKGHTNTWAADALDLSTDTDIGTPTVNANVSSGPFAVWGKAAECDELVAANVLALDGKRGATAGTAAGYYNVSAFLKAGLTGVTRTKAQLCGVVAGGTGSACCNVTGLTSTATRFQCTILAAGGGITSVRPEVRVGNATPDVGSIQVCHRQHTYGPNTEPPEPDNTAHGNLYYSLDATADGWPNAALGGKREVAFIPKYDPDTQWVAGQTEAMRVLDSYVAAADHSVAFVFGYSTPARLLVTSRDAVGGNSDITVDGIGLTAGTPYAAALAWRPLGGGKCRLYAYLNACAGGVCNHPTTGDATTLVASDVTGTAVCPSTPTDALMGIRGPDVSAFPSSLTIIGVRNYSL